MVLEITRWHAWFWARLRGWGGRSIGPMRPVAVRERAVTLWQFFDLGAGTTPFRTMLAERSEDPARPR